ncbi:OPT oligopeptide transporter protein-domain-containing protein [Hygrophoropsis aurantiaca]|uniref:OPT oligopeptide transporter protein-domain-containing protein n=1 Tax=Hygrophoropsis aurantiaca TaxID=72124 RepID=A0ACB8A907_9AGAM|nr:OPT oligopeptide transporter protein-domain-containing protein [Hygrophoropsis aurantiaca]
MDHEDVDVLQTIIEKHPGYARFINHISSLTESYLPPFIYLTDINNPRLTFSALDSLLKNASYVPDFPPILYAHVNAVKCFNLRLFFDTVLNALSGWKTSWENGCQNWPGDSSERYNDSIDSFLHGLQLLRSQAVDKVNAKGKGKGKEKARGTDRAGEEPCMVILVEKAERLRDNLPELMVPLTRLAELSQVRISVILLSSVRWEDIKPPLGASPDPYYIDMDPLTKEDTIQRLVASYSSVCQVQETLNGTNNAYHPALLPLYEHYAAVVYSVCGLYTHDPNELQYIAAARWPGFVKPVLEEHERTVAEAQSQNPSGDDSLFDAGVELVPPTEVARMRLTRYFTPSLTAALEALLPRLTNATDWAIENDPDLDAMENGTRRGERAKRAVEPVTTSISVTHLPRMSKFILVAAFLASTNPAKSDMRMFGRGADEAKKRRRKGGSPKKSKGQSAVAKVPQRLLGPAAFPLDRLLAILGSLLEENDVETRPYAPEYQLSGEYSEMEVGRVHVYAAISELTAMRSLHRTSAPDRLDGPPMFKCGISYESSMPFEFEYGSQAFALHPLGQRKSLELESEPGKEKLTEDEQVRPVSRATVLSNYNSHNGDDDATTFDDPNIDPEQLAEFDDESPYPEVRSAVANTDDQSIPVLTIRTWVIGLAWSIIMPGVNQFFFFRYPSVPITGIVAQLLSYPLGQMWAAYLPRKRILGISLNPGPFTIKEHVLITIMASVGAQSAYATDIIAVQRVYYNQNYSFSYQWFIVVSSQLIGFSAGGIARRFLVSPPSMIWPATLVSCALFNTLHSQQYAGIGALGGISRERYFAFVCACSFFWYFFPGYLFTALSYFSWVTWIYPGDPVVAQLFGYVHGMGMSIVTFDWSQIAYIGSPLATPWWASANIFGGFVLFYCKLSYLSFRAFTNTWYSLYMPISSRQSYDNTGNCYDVSRILTKEYTFDAEAYQQYSPVFLPTTFAMSYGLSFASITATLVHAFIYFRKQIVYQARRSLREQADIHARLMNRYPQVPDLWYLVLFAAMFALGVVSIEIWPTDMPVWAFVIALLIAFTYVIPCGMIQAITNQQIGLNVVTELIIGYALPGRPIAMMMFKTWGYITMTQALTFTADFKLGHYMKIPPRQMFWCQIIATIIAGSTQLAVQAWMFQNIPDMCSQTQKNGFTCPSTVVFGSASIIWGVVGPKLQFSSGQLYKALLYFFLIGAIAPIIPWLVMKRYPNSFTRYIKSPLIFNGTYLIPPATAVNYVPWAMVGFIFQYVIRRRNFSWWAKYNYVTSAALDAGLAVSACFIFFTLQYPRNGTIGEHTVQSWWGNQVWKTGSDYRGTPVRELGSQETFGPSTW